MTSWQCILDLTGGPFIIVHEQYISLLSFRKVRGIRILLAKGYYGGWGYAALSETKMSTSP